MALAMHIASWSKDQSRPTGCVIVGEDRIIRVIGYNGFPRGVNDEIPERHLRPAKYSWTEHAERNAIYNAARIGTSLAGCTMYLTWFPCIDCARAIVQAGIVRLVAFEPDRHDPKWGQDFDMSLKLFKEVNLSLSLLPRSAASSESQ